MITSETTDPDDPRLGHGPDITPVPQNKAYLVLSEQERAKGFVRPVRDSYRHVGAEGRTAYLSAALREPGDGCGQVTTMSRALAETYARAPAFYSGTYCTTCQMHRPVGMHGEFVWVEPGGTDGPRVGT